VAFDSHIHHIVASPHITKVKAVSIMSGLDDLDDELLELAGGVQSGGEAEQNKRQDSRDSSSRGSFSPTPPARTSDKASLRRDRKSTPHSDSFQRRKDESEEEGEAYAPAHSLIRTFPFTDTYLSSSAADSPRSLGSDAMDESASDSAGASDKSDNGKALYPLEGKYKNSKDKSQLMALPDLQREEILADRASKIADEKKMTELRQLLENKDRETLKDRKRKAPADDRYGDNSPRKLSRPRTKKDEALQSLKERRDANRIEDSRRAAASRKLSGRRHSKSSTRSTQSSQRDADGESDYDVPAKKAASDPLGTLADYQRVRIGRTNFVEVCFYPTFEKTIVGCFTRVCYSTDPQTGDNIYRMAQIKCDSTRDIGDGHC
jgi:RNA polymerase-associated protein RTF1